jgi:sulfoxide reductase heme-binding subunit YedZ
MKDIKFNKLVLFINGMVPLALLGWDAYHNRIGANPIEFVTRTTGILTLVFLLLTLSITPLRKLTKIQWLIRFRRMLGLYAFFYGSLHFITYVWFDKFFHLKTIGEDILNRPFIAVGMTAFFLMVPLAITSTDKMIKRVGGKRWQSLHRLVYISAIGGVFHYWLLVKADTRIPLRFAAVLAVLLGYRLFTKYQLSPPQRTTRTLTPPR